MPTDWKTLCAWATEEIEQTLAEMPAPLRDQAKNLPICFENSPNAALQATGIAADTLGLFTGAEFADAQNEVLPAQILLFIGNLWDFAGEDPEVFKTEVHTTFLHELGHFFSLDEDDLTSRGLE